MVSSALAVLGAAWHGAWTVAQQVTPDSPAFWNSALGAAVGSTPLTVFAVWVLRKTMAERDEAHRLLFGLIPGLGGAVRAVRDTESEVVAELRDVVDRLAGQLPQERRHGHGR